jgi:hypothetical protein
MRMKFTVKRQEAFEHQTDANRRDPIKPIEAFPRQTGMPEREFVKQTVFFKDNAARGSPG